MPRVTGDQLACWDTTVRSCPSAHCVCFTRLHKVADRLAEANPSFDRWRFLVIAYEVFGETIRPVTGPDPRD
jgi:hypothetical protein